MMISLVRFYLLLRLVSCKVDTSRWVGLTHPLSPEGSVYSMVYTPMKVDNERSKHTSSWPGTDIDGIFVAFRYIEFFEHTGTHVDAPIHFDENGKTEDQLTWEELTGSLNIVDVRHKVKFLHVVSTFVWSPLFVKPNMPDSHSDRFFSKLQTSH